MPCTEWHTSVDSQRLSTVDLKLKAFLAVDSGAWFETDTVDLTAKTLLSHPLSRGFDCPVDSSRMWYRRVSCV
eukprot:3274589-Pyramimonas_sp.AAC.1